MTIGRTLIFQTCPKTRAEIALYPYIPNMLQNSCRNRIVSYTVERWSYYFRTNVIVYRTISYKLETDRAKLL